MSEKIEGYSYQEHEPTPDDPCKIKTIVCNGIEIPVEFLKQNFVTVDGKKYIELQQENQQLKERNENQFNDLMKRIHSNNDKHLEESNKLIKENIQLKEVIKEAKEVIRDSHVEVLKYHDEPSETTSYEIVTVELLQILDKIK